MGNHKEAHSGVKEKRGKSVKFRKNTEEMNIMDTYVVPKKRGKSQHQRKIATLT